ncbi:MAG: glycosyltransferase [Candidatus Gastranaerophilales bacterium]|nr:glycosyltransferase [Candidatus Gastranaerophilales bacterium]
MEKVLVILSDNNKGKFIAKGFSSAFKELHYFVYEKKIYDLNIEEINKISPNIIFVLWTDMTQRDVLIDFLNTYENKSSSFIHSAELLSHIDNSFINKKNHFVFTSDSKNKKFKFLHSVSPKDYKSKFSGYSYNITFAGNPAYRNREELLAKLVYNFGPINIFCRSYDFYKSLDDIQKNSLLDDYMLELYKSSYKGYVESQKELSKIYISSKINIDIENENPKNLNYRFLEVLASGGFLIAPHNNKIVKYFEDGKEFETYSSDFELIDKIEFYLKNLNIAQLIAYNGKKNVVSNHSFYDRLKSMLKVIYGKDFSSRR